jgi:hypothetical protein
MLIRVRVFVAVSSEVLSGHLRLALRVELERRWLPSHAEYMEHIQQYSAIM